MRQLPHLPHCGYGPGSCSYLVPIVFKSGLSYVKHTIGGYMHFKTWLYIINCHNTFTVTFISSIHSSSGTSMPTLFLIHNQIMLVAHFPLYF